MPDLNDYHAFTNTSSSRSSSGKSSGSGSNGSSNEGCAGVFVWIFAIGTLLWFIIKLAA